MKNSKRNPFVDVGLSLLMLIGLFPPQAARADEGADWKAMQTMEKQMGDKATAEARISGYQQFLEASKPGAVVGCTALGHIADAQREQKQYDEAIATCRRGLAAYATEPGAVVVLPSLLAALRESGQGAEAADAPATYWPLLVSAARSHHPVLITHTSLALREIDMAQSALIADTKSPDAERAATRQKRILMLQRALIEMPLYLDDRRQASGGYFEGWMQESLLETLSGDPKTHKEMLGWAKLYFMTSAFDAKAIERATRGLSKAWAANDDFGAVRAFAKAQDEPKAGAAPAPNPLSRIAAPSLVAANAEFLNERVAYLSDLPGYDRERSSELVSLYLVQAGLSSAGKVADGKAQRTAAEKAALSAAMENAKKLMGGQPDDAAGMEQVCRVFKAADGGTTRANAFIAHLNGQGDNPLPAFFDEMK